MYDVIIVGGGSAGCVLAARLSEDPSRKVLLLEAGGDERRPDIENPIAWANTLGTDVDWNYITTPQQATGRRYACHRGKVLGGSGSINLMTHIRGHRLDFDRWAELGAIGWDYESVLPFFKKSEHVPGGDPRYRGLGGPLIPRPVENPHPLATAYIEAAHQAGHHIVDDLNAAELMGASRQDILIADGKRQSTATAFLRPAMTRPNLTVQTNTVVHRLIFEGSRCTGVECRVSGSHTTIDGGEVVLCCGAIDTPKLLMLSGVGAARELHPMGIAPKFDLPGVGQNLQDHVLLAGFRLKSQKPLPPPSGNLADATLFTKTAPDQQRPELQIVMVQVDYHTPWQSPLENSFTFGIGHMRPKSRGTIRLQSGNPDDPVAINFNYLSDPYDIDQLVAGVEAVDRLSRTAAFDEWRGCSEASELMKTGTANIEQAIKQGLGSYFHPSGSCRMGIDAMSVVNPGLKVHGVQRVTIADASIMPEIVSANTAAATIMIAEKAADLLCR